MCIGLDGDDEHYLGFSNGSLIVEGLTDLELVFNI